MKRSTDRILTTHAGSLPLPPDLKEMLVAKNNGQPYDKEALAKRVKSAVAEAVKKQLDCGLDIINDGELGKPNFSRYTRERLSGFVERPARADERPSTIYGRDLKEFAEYFQKRTTTMRGENVWRVFCNGPLKYIGHDAVKADIETFREALKGQKYEEAFLPAVAPGTLEHWLKNDYYKTDEEYLFALAEAMREEYKAIVDSGFLLQIDNPDLPDAWQIYPEMSVADYRKYAGMRVDALNHALRDLPPDRIRFHTCWGSYHGPHKYDIPLRDIVDLILKVRANTYSIEAANVRHEHEWRVWEEVKLPEGKVLVPGVVGHATDIVEHPRLIADRLIRYAKIVGRENVMGGTDCGLGPRVGHANIAWAKFEAMAEGARIATRELWGK
ncbi:MAG TPA: cobalamin-independent methionine synthase II family protein [Verrucomicrobiae bacterium]|jgi:5-methyltetrahydropteroyltriglutamate--homocysteine methyltransferase|nr:cobalamin-independent methionine synthase II family protein [Verrucomicrobiae bacterium]